jgi:small multidrug resistance family-3 protein
LANPWNIIAVVICLSFTLVESSYAGRAYAAYGAIYICASLAWMWIIENNSPSKVDILGAVVCLAGAGIILFAQKI